MRILFLAAASAALGGAASVIGENRPVAEVAPGHVVRWPGPSLLSCSLGERRWAPENGACWYPIDLERTGELELVRRSAGGVASRLVRVAEYPYPVQRLEVEDRYVEPPPEVAARIARERERVVALFGLDTPRQYALPLGSPLARLPSGGRFGARRVFNDQPRSPHSGADFAAAAGTPVQAVAEGRVVLAEEHYFAGKSVFVDHGGGLLSMSFHLSEIAVEEGAEVARGALIGRVGATGRVTGAHLHFGLRWHGARVDPERLIGELRVVDIR
jgi:murein DD-endopeptidase MepM/ murein hydrolase activator NlpD